MRQYTHWAWNLSAQHASCHGAATPGGSIFPKTVSSAIARCKRRWEKMSRSIRRKGTSMPGCHASPWKTRPSRHSCHSSRSWCISCFLNHPMHLCSQGKLRQLVQCRQTVQPITTSCQTAGLPSLTWVQAKIPEAVPGPLHPLPLSHAGQQPLQLPGSPSARAAGQVANMGSASRALLSQPWASPINTGFPTSPVAEGMTPVQVPMQLKGKIQWGEYVDLSELLACDFNIATPAWTTPRPSR